MSWFGLLEAKNGCEPNCEVCPLSRVREGVAVRVRQLCAAPELRNRLREFGFCEDQVIRLLTSQTNFICQVCNSRLAISEQVAQMIMVEPVQPKPALARATVRRPRR
jgi:Fe2+ transport system protein FeoA